MGKRRGGLKQIKALQKSAKKSPKASPQEQLDQFLEKEQYLAALDLLNRIRKSQPGLLLTPGEGSIRLRLGQQELGRSQYKTAEVHFRKALDLAASKEGHLERDAEHWQGDAYYFYAKSLICQERCAEALSFIQAAFEQEKLPKTHAGCYLKLLLLQGETERVKTLMTEQPNRFYAAQLHWVRGIFALQAEDPEGAIAHFRKSKDPVTPGDSPKAWPIYTRQCQADWSDAAMQLHGLQNALSPRLGGQNAWIEWLDLNQRIRSDKPAYPAYGRTLGLEASPVLTLLELIQLLENDEVHDAGHAFLRLDPKDADFPELKALRYPLMMAAGDQSINDRELDCAEGFWEEIAQEKPFHLQLNLNLLHVQQHNGSTRAGLATVTRLVDWLNRDAEAHHWPEAQRQEASLQLHCIASDFQISLNGRTAALKEIRLAERINAQHPEVLGRRGMVAYVDDDFDRAIALLTQALEKGCELFNAYNALLECFDEIGNKAGKREARQRFGKTFGDVIEASEEIDLPSWLEAIATQRYLIFESLIDPEDPEGPEDVACGWFVDAVESEPNKAGRVDLNLKQATQKWDELLGMCNPAEKVTVLQAIALCLQLFCKRIKGRDALIQQYQAQLLTLESEEPEALKVYLALVSLKNTATATRQMRPHLTRYLKRSPEPGTALAQIQLKARWFGRSDALLPFIEDALKKESQNPQLLLAKATVYPLKSQFYEQYTDQGFDIARRLQDTAALQAFREEQAFQSHWHTREAMPKNLTNFDDMDPAGINKMLERMIRSMLGPNVSDREIKAMLPIFKQQMLERMGMPFGFDD